MSSNLKALEILKEIKTSFISTEDEEYIQICEAIAELEQYEENFKQKEFKYRTDCQNLVSTGRVEADNIPDRLAELEKVILDYYLDKGYQVGVGYWGFKVVTASVYKGKGCKVIFFENFEPNEVYKNSTPTTKEMWDKAFEYFSSK